MAGPRPKSDVRFIRRPQKNLTVQPPSFFHCASASITTARRRQPPCTTSTRPLPSATGPSTDMPAAAPAVAV